jgi:hypothetical protein
MPYMQYTSRNTCDRGELAGGNEVIPAIYWRSSQLLVSIDSHRYSNSQTRVIYKFNSLSKTFIMPNKGKEKETSKLLESTHLGA